MDADLKKDIKKIRIALEGIRKIMQEEVKIKQEELCLRFQDYRKEMEGAN